MKEYRTVAQEGEQEFIEKRSRFIGYAAPVESEEEALRLLGERRALHREASHNVWAYVLRDGQIRRYSDDGEPQGTAGIPVLDVLLKGELVDALVVVTRYFGGTLLGAGGLVRAYSHTAKLAVDAAGIRCMTPCTVFRLQMDYSWYGKITYFLPEFRTVVLDTQFAEVVTMVLRIPTQDCPGFLKKLREVSFGSIVPEKIEENYAFVEEN